jgi:predicted ArsR family transcriptional regulator
VEPRSPLTALHNPVRRRLYELVAAADRPIGRDEAAASAGVGRSLAAYHLDKLAEDGLLETSFARLGKRTGPGAGRPAKLYRRSREEFSLRVPPRDYQLLGELLVRAVDRVPDGAVQSTVEEVASELGRSIGEKARQQPVVGRRALGDLLRSRGYEPVEDEDGTLRLRNCPFEAVASRYPELVCRLNLRLLEGFIEGLGMRSARAVLAPARGHCCVAITTSH